MNFSAIRPGIEIEPSKYLDSIVAFSDCINNIFLIRFQRLASQSCHRIFADTEVTYPRSGPSIFCWLSVLVSVVAVDHLK